MASSRKLPDIVGVVATRNSLNRPKILHHAGFETKQVDSGKNVLVLCLDRGRKPTIAKPPPI